MAEEPAKKKGSALSGKTLGLPTPVVVIGGGAGAFLLYRWYKNRQSSSSTATPAATASPNAATGTDSGVGAGFTGTGSSGGGGGGLGQANNALLQQIESQLAGLGTGVVPAGTGAVSGSGDTSGSSSNGAATGGGTGAASGSNSTGSAATAAKTALVPDTFQFKDAKVSFVPTAKVTRGNQVAYGIPNTATGSTLKNAGGDVKTGAQLSQQGWTGLTPKAAYLVR